MFAKRIRKRNKNESARYHGHNFQDTNFSGRFMFASLFSDLCEPLTVAFQLCNFFHSSYKQKRITCN